MPHTTTAVAVTALAAAGVATLLATSGADAKARTHTQHFDAMATAQLSTSATSFVLAEQDVANSTVIGHDVLYCQATRTHSTCQLALAQKGGLLYARFVLRDSDHSARGTVIGGTGPFAHAHGTITAQTLSATDVRVTLRYQD